MKMQGIVLSAEMITFAFFSPVVVCLIQRFGQKNIMILSAILKSSCAVGFALSSLIKDPWTFWVLSFTLRLIEGMGDSCNSISYTTIVSS